MKKVLLALMGAAWLWMVPGTGRAVFVPFEPVLDPCQVVYNKLNNFTEEPLVMSVAIDARLELTDEGTCQLIAASSEKLTLSSYSNGMFYGQTIDGSMDPLRSFETVGNGFNFVYDIPDAVDFINYQHYRISFFYGDSGGTPSSQVYFLNLEEYPPPPSDEGVSGGGEGTTGSGGDSGGGAGGDVGAGAGDGGGGDVIGDVADGEGEGGGELLSPDASDVTFRDFPEDESVDQITGGGTCQLNPSAAPQSFSLAWLVLAGLAGMRRRLRDR